MTYNCPELILSNPIPKYIDDEFIYDLKDKYKIELVLKVLPKEFITKELVDNFMETLSQGGHDNYISFINIDKELVDYDKLRDIIRQYPYVINIFHHDMLDDDLVILSMVSSNYKLRGLSVILDKFPKAEEFYKKYLLHYGNENNKVPFLPFKEMDEQFLKEFTDIHINYSYNDQLEIDQDTFSKVYKYINKDIINKLKNRYDYFSFEILRNDFTIEHLIDCINNGIVYCYNGFLSNDSNNLTVNNIKYIMDNLKPELLNNFLRYSQWNWTNKEILDIVVPYMYSNKIIHHGNINQILEYYPSYIYEILNNACKNDTQSLLLLSAVDHKFFNEEILLKIRDLVMKNSKYTGCLYTILKYYPYYFSYDDLLHFLKSNDDHSLGYVRIYISVINPSYLTQEVLDIIFSEKYTDTYYENLNRLSYLGLI